MRLNCIFIACFVLFVFCSRTRSEFNSSPDKCCFSFSTIKIPVKQVVSYHTTHTQCNKNGIIFITKNQREICADPTEKWVQRLMNLVKRQSVEIWGEISPTHKMPVTSSKVEMKVESMRTTETTPPLQPEETTLVQLKESHDWIDFDTTQADLNTKKVESMRTTETTPPLQPEETTLVQLKESHDWIDFDTTQADLNTKFAYFCKRPEGE